MTKNIYTILLSITELSQLTKCFCLLDSHQFSNDGKKNKPVHTFQGLDGVFSDSARFLIY